MNPSPRQLSVEVDRVTRNDSMIDLPGLHLIPRDEQVRSQPPELYRPPPFLRKTATGEQYEELTVLLHRLWEANEEHVGENTLEVQVYYSVTGMYLDLAESLRRWSEIYFRSRADTRHLTPQVGNDPYILFVKRLEELDAILGRLNIRLHTLNSTFLSLAMEFVPWLLYRCLWEDLIRVEVDDGKGWYFAAPGYCPPRRQLARMAALAVGQGWADSHLDRLLDRVAHVADPRRLEEIASRPDGVLHDALARMAADIQEMRVLLVRGFRPARTALTLGDSLAAAWAWCIHAGIANLVVGNDVVEVGAAVEGNRTKMMVAVGHDGLLFDARTPWLKADGLGPVCGHRPLVLNYHVLNLFHERLFSFYDRIDFGRLQAEGLAQGEAEIPSEEAVVAALAASCHDLGDQEEDEEADRRRIRQLRSTRLLTVLADRFGCEVRQGKGSEVTVFREGGRKFTLGHHGRCVEVHPVVLRRMLGRLGISPGEWLRRSCA